MNAFTRSDLYNMAQEEKAAAVAGEVSAPFYLTLCQVVMPVSVPESKAPALQRFRFFFSRHDQGGQPRYWLHFGYFTSHHEAKRWCDILGRIYPRAAIRKLSPQGGLTEPTATQPALTETQVMRMLSGNASSGQAEQTGTFKMPSSGHPKGQSPGLEASLKELRASAWETMELEDTASMSGVRHLRVEIETKSTSRKHRASNRKA
jgi:hypothetical protein